MSFRTALARSFTRNPIFRFLGSGGAMSCPNRIENHPKLGIVFLFQSSELSGQIFV